VNIPELIETELERGWEGTVDDWWAAHPWVLTVNSIAPTFTHLKKAGRIESAGRKLTRSGSLANVWRAA
jgi:hypothetical protein